MLQDYFPPDEVIPSERLKLQVDGGHFDTSSKAFLKDLVIFLWILY